MKKILTISLLLSSYNLFCMHENQHRLTNFYAAHYQHMLHLRQATHNNATVIRQILQRQHAAAQYKTAMDYFSTQEMLKRRQTHFQLFQEVKQQLTDSSLIEKCANDTSPSLKVMNYEQTILSRIIRIDDLERQDPGLLKMRQQNKANLLGIVTHPVFKKRLNTVWEAKPLV